MQDLKNFLGRVMRDIERRVANDTVKKAFFEEALKLAHQLLTQQKNDKNKIYSIHEPSVECISKGKERKKFEFGNKVSLVATSAEGFVIGAQWLHGNPYDGHTLVGALEQAERLCDAGKIQQAFTDLGYRGHDYEGAIKVQVCDLPALSADRQAAGRPAKEQKKVTASVAKFNEATSGD